MATEDSGVGGVELLAVVVTPHTYSEEILYRRAPDPEKGALVRLVLANDSGQDVAFELLFNGQKPERLIESGAWTWCEMPGEKAPADGPYTLAHGCHEVFTFNGADSRWGPGIAFELTLRDARSGVDRAEQVVLSEPEIRFERIVFLSEDDTALAPDTMVAHVVNKTSSPLRPVSVRLFRPTDAGYEQFLESDSIETFGGTGVLPEGAWSGMHVDTGTLPLVRGLVQAEFATPDGKPEHLWAPLMFKRERFDIGCGWMDIPACGEGSPLLRASFLKLLRRMHVNLAHNEQVPGYTDSTGPEGLYTRYPLRLMSFFNDVAIYNTDDWVARIHGVDCLGEPQMGVSPMDSYRALRHYKDTRYPTTVTLSEDKGFRYYAGLSDYPHFDAYRVTAPAADSWRLYDRWDGESIRWGAPLEGVGAMTRTLHAVSRPAPISAWTQHVHEGWEDQRSRPRKSPTSDEILVQAYEVLANGITSLYWYSMQSWSLLKYADTLETSVRIGREMRMLEPLYLAGVPFWHRRVGDAARPILDLNVVAAPDAAVLFAIDLEYVPDPDEKVFRFRGAREWNAVFPLPPHLRPVIDVFRVDADGVHDVTWKATDDGVSVTGTLEHVAVFVAAPTDAWRAKISERREALLAVEEATGFDPVSNPADFETLVRDLGCDPADYSFPKSSMP